MSALPFKRASPADLADTGHLIKSLLRADWSRRFFPFLACVFAGGNRAYIWLVPVRGLEDWAFSAGDVLALQRFIHGLAINLRVLVQSTKEQEVVRLDRAWRSALDVIE